MAATTASNDELLSVAMLAAQRDRPYLAVGLSHLVRRFGDLRPFHTMAVRRDGVMIVDPQFLRSNPAPKLGEAVVHEMMHLLRDHGTRADAIPGVNRDAWNIAADCEINDDLRKDVLGAEYCYPENFGFQPGLMAEEYYAKLMEGAKGGKGKGNQRGKAGQDSGEGDGEGDGDGPKGGVAAGGCGSGSGGNPTEGEGEAAAGAKGRSEADVARMREAVAQAILEHAARGRGTVPDGMLRWAQEAIKPPKVRWQDKLRRAVRSGVATAAGKTDYSRTRFSRRQGGLAAAAARIGRVAPLMPALVGPKPKVVFGVDTSGSMGIEELRRAVSEADGVLRALGVPLTFLACDCQCAEPKQVRTAKELAESLRGGGGTDFNPIFEAVSKVKPAPNLFIFVTDGMGPAPAAPPAGFETIWVLVGPYRTRPANWGEVVEIDE